MKQNSFQKTEKIQVFTKPVSSNLVYSKCDILNQRENMSNSINNIEIID